jgi:hypothetical protein
MYASELQTENGCVRLEVFLTIIRTIDGIELVEERALAGCSHLVFEGTKQCSESKIGTDPTQGIDIVEQLVDYRLLFGRRVTTNDIFVVLGTDVSPHVDVTVSGKGGGAFRVRQEATVRVGRGGIVRVGQ